MYDKIKNPLTNRYVNTSSNLGQKILKNYLNQLGSGGDCGINPDTGRCGKKFPDNDPELCEMSPKGRCRKIQSINQSQVESRPKRRDLSAAMERRRLARYVDDVFRDEQGRGPVTRRVEVESAKRAVNPNYDSELEEQRRIKRERAKLVRRQKDEMEKERIVKGEKRAHKAFNRHYNTTRLTGEKKKRHEMMRKFDLGTCRNVTTNVDEYINPRVGDRGGPGQLDYPNIDCFDPMYTRGRVKKGGMLSEEWEDPDLISDTLRILRKHSKRPKDALEDIEGDELLGVLINLDKSILEEHGLSEISTKVLELHYAEDKAKRQKLEVANKKKAQMAFNRHYKGWKTNKKVNQARLYDLNRCNRDSLVTDVNVYARHPGRNEYVGVDGCL